MHLTLLNLTTESVVYRLSGINNFKVQELTLSAKTRTSIELPKGTQVALSRGGTSTNFYHNESKECPIRTGGALLHVPLPFSARWKAVSVPDECPWLIYLSRARLCFLHATVPLTGV